MNEQIKKLAIDAGQGEVYHIPPEFINKFSTLIIEEHIKLLRREWYDRNNEEYPEDMSPRDIGVKVGQKNQIIVLIEKIKQYWNI